MIYLKDIKDLISLSNTDEVPLPFRLQPDVPLVLTFKDFTEIICEASFTDLNKVWNGVKIRKVLDDTTNTKQDKADLYFKFLYHLGLIELSYSVVYAYPPTPIYHRFEDGGASLSKNFMEEYLHKIKAVELPSYVTQDMVRYNLLKADKVNFVNSNYKSELLYLAFLKYQIPDLEPYWNISI